MKNRAAKKSGLHREWYLVPGLVGVLLFYLIPLLGSFRYIVTAGVIDRRFTGTANLAELLKNPAFLLAAGNTFLFMGIGVPVLMALSLTVSFLLMDGGYRAVRVMLLVPFIIPSSALMPGVRALLEEGGFLTEHPLAVLLFVYLLKNLGYLTVVLSAGMKRLAGEYREVWMLEKRPGLDFLYRIVIPVIMPEVFFSVLLALMGCLKIFREAYLLYGDSPPGAVYLLQHFMNHNFYRLNFQRLAGAAFLVIFGLTILIALFLGLENRMKAKEGAL